MRAHSIRLIAMIALLVYGASAPASDRAVPYWASITAGEAFLRSGPGRNYPAVWRYRRAGLPVIVLQVHESWRRVRDQEGTEGWMAAVLLSAERTAMVVGQIQPMRGAPNSAARLLWRVAPGVVGGIKHCSRGWCEFAVGGRVGYVQVSGLWGVGSNEVLD
jgi:SH3-like domain-containing protein